MREEELEPWREPPAPEPPPLSALLAELGERRGWAKRLEGARVHEHWPEIAGEQLARQTEPVRLVGGVLVVRVASTTWATQVRYLSGELLRRANEVLGDGAVRQVTVVTGAAPGRAP